MYAFYKTNNGGTIKANDQAGDWQLQAGKIERWFSQWSFDRKASLEAAFIRFLEDHYDETFDRRQMTVC